MSNRELSATEFATLVVGGGALLVFFFVSWQLASWMEVSLSVVANSLFASLLCIGLALGLFFWFRMASLRVYLTAASWLVWPQWFDVVREAADKYGTMHAFQSRGLELVGHEYPWWGTDWTLYGSEFVLIVGSLLVLNYVSNRY